MEDDYVYVFVSQPIVECGTPDLDIAVFKDLDVAKKFKKDTKE